MSYRDLIQSILPSVGIHLIVGADRDYTMAWARWLVRGIHESSTLWGWRTRIPQIVGWIGRARPELEDLQVFDVTTGQDSELQSCLRNLWTGAPPAKGAEDFPVLDAALQHFERAAGEPLDDAILLVLEDIHLLGIETQGRGARLSGGLMVLHQWCRRHNAALLILHPIAKQSADSSQRYLQVADLPYGSVQLTHQTDTKFILLDPKMAGRKDKVFTLYTLGTQQEQPVRYFRRSPAGEFGEIPAPEFPGSKQPADKDHNTEPTPMQRVLLAWETLRTVGVTAAECLKHLRAQGSSESRATCYRQLNNLVSTGHLVKRGRLYMLPPSTPTTTAYCAEEFELPPAISS